LRSRGVALDALQDLSFRSQGTGVDESDAQLSSNLGFDGHDDTKEKRLEEYVFEARPLGFVPFLGQTKHG
jgi:hypothetical protein